MQEVNIEVVKSEYQKLVGLYSQIEEINEEIKLIKSSLKPEGVNPSLICKIALASVKGNKDNLTEDANELLEFVEIL